MVDAIIANGLSKQFGKTLALNDVSLTVPAGSVYCVAGPNGSGKTTLLNILSGSLRPTSGSLSVHGSSGYCHQNPQLYPDLTVFQNLVLFSEMLSASREKMENAISRLGLGELLKKTPSELSSGTKKKVELAISILPDPEIVFLDEPTTGLDRMGAEEFLSLIKNFPGTKTLVIATHQLSDVENVATHLLVLKRGNKLFEGTVSGSLEKTYRKKIK